MVIVIVLILLMVTFNPVTADTNLALKKPIYASSIYNSYCLPENAVDGILNKTILPVGGGTLPNMANTIVGEPGWYVVDMLGKYRVQKVTVYSRPDCCYYRLQGFFVGFTNNFTDNTNKTLIKNSLCGTSTAKFNSVKVDTVSCTNPLLKSRFVMLQQAVTSGEFGVAELEVYGAEIYDDQYIGCFDYTIINSKSTMNVTSLDQCASTCNNTQSLYFALKNGYECHCINSISSSMTSSSLTSSSSSSPLSSSSSSNCNLSCPDNNYMCGGSNFFSLYNVQRCQYISYSSSSFSSSSNQCTIVTHCSNNANVDIYGQCGVGSCGNGWMGDACDMRDCSVNNGLCGIHECKLNSIGVANITECVCKSGYYKPTFRSDCIDMDECSFPTLNNCDSNSTYCLNKNGSYECQCKSGYENNSDIYSCQDIDECPTQCNATNENCTNTPGSYICGCIPGYTRNDTCIDINECLDENFCKITGKNKSLDCENTNGSYTCICTTGSFNKAEQICEVPTTIPTTNEDKKLPAIIGGVIGCFLALILIIALILVFVMRGRKKPKKSPPSSDENIVMGKSTNIPKEKIEEYYNKNIDEISEQFASVPFVNKKSCEDAKNVDKAKKKNRYKGIYPFDENRVKLGILKNFPNSDYINASYIKSYKPDEYQFIASQGPQPSTLEDFWRMVWEVESENIVMLTLPLEDSKMKCVQYWPDSGNMTLNLSSNNNGLDNDFDSNSNHNNNNVISITLTKVAEWPTYEIRTLLVNYMSLERQITHLWYKCWPDQGVPNNIGSLLNFHHHMKSLMARSRERNNGGGGKAVRSTNVVVHCSAGVGRTGTYLGLDYLLEQCDDTGFVDVFQCLKYLRSQRNNMIQKPVQYEFCYRALITYVKLDGRTCFNVGEDRLSEFVEGRVKKELYKNQLDIIKEKFNDPKQHVKQVVRKRLAHGHMDMFTQRGFAKTQTYAIGALTDNITGDDFYDVILSEKPSFVVLVNEDFQRYSFIPNEGNAIITFKKFKVQHVTSGNDDVTIRVIRKPRNYENRNFMEEEVYENVTNQPDTVVIFSLKSLNQIRQLYQLLKDALKDPNTPPIPLLFRQSTDMNVAEVVVMLSLLEMMNTHEEIDVYQAVYQLQPHNNNNNSSRTLRSLRHYDYNNNDDSDDGDGVKIDVEKYIQFYSLARLHLAGLTDCNVINRNNLNNKNHINNSNNHNNNDADENGPLRNSDCLHSYNLKSRKTLMAEKAGNTNNNSHINDLAIYVNTNNNNHVNDNSNHVNDNSNHGYPNNSSYPLDNDTYNYDNDKHSVTTGTNFNGHEYGNLNINNNNDNNNDNDNNDNDDNDDDSNDNSHNNDDHHYYNNDNFKHSNSLNKIDVIHEEDEEDYNEKIQYDTPQDVKMYGNL